MDKLRVTSHAKRIEVNDGGEYITLNLDDQAFAPALMAIIDGFNAKIPEYENRARELDGAPAETEQEKMDKLRRVMAFNLAIHQELKEQVDGVFHDEACRKVFGDIVPPVEAYAEFFTQLTPFIQQYAKERGEKMGQYSAARSGNV